MDVQVAGPLGVIATTSVKAGAVDKILVTNITINDIKNK